MTDENTVEEETKANEEVMAEQATDESVEESSEDNVEEISEKVEEKEEDFKAKFYYLAAEMDNMKKRHNRERESLIKYGNEKILKGLIDVIDTLELSVNAIAEDEDEKVQNIRKGVEMVRNQFVDVLKKNGLETVESVGQSFDPNFHEAMAQQPAEGKEDGEVIVEYQKGYVLNGRLLRASKVVIAKN